jgi:hypothetical protein
MATTKAPLFGLDASGSLAKSIVFSKWKGRTYVRRHAVPANPQSPLQVSMRAMFSFLTKYFKSLSAGDLAAWQLLATESQTTALNQFVKANQERHRFNKKPGTEPTFPETGVAPSAAATFTAGNDRRSSTLAWTAGANAPDFCWMVSMSTAAITTMSVDDTILVVPAATLTTRVAPLLPGTLYHFRVRGVMKTGLSGSQSAEVTATPVS